MSTGYRKALAEAIYKAPLPLRRQLMFAAFHHAKGNFTNPRTFSEKVNWRILNDRRPLLAWTCDKLAIKDNVAAHVRTPTTYWSGTDLRELEGVDLPKAWVLKPNHRSRLVHYGSGPVRDTDELIRKTRGWLADLQGEKKGEWAYTQARRVFLVEEMVGSVALPPADYRFLVYAGDIRYVQVLYDVNRLHGVPTRRYYTGDWEPLQVRQQVALARPEPMPARYDEMRRIAAAVGAPFDFVRVDLYDCNGEILLGEVTAYPGGGLVPFQPPEFDLELGEPWVLPTLDRNGLAAASAALASPRKVAADEAIPPIRTT